MQHPHNPNRVRLRLEQLEVRDQPALLTFLSSEISGTLHLSETHENYGDSHTFTPQDSGLSDDSESPVFLTNSGVSSVSARWSQSHSGHNYHQFRLEGSTSHVDFANQGTPFTRTGSATVGASYLRRFRIDADAGEQVGDTVLLVEYGPAVELTRDDDNDDTTVVTGLITITTPSGTYTRDAESSTIDPNGLPVRIGQEITVRLHGTIQSEPPAWDRGARREFKLGADLTVASTTTNLKAVELAHNPISGTITATYQVAGQPLPNAGQLALLWANAPVIDENTTVVGDAAPAITIPANTGAGTYQKEWDVSTLLPRPEGATHLVMKVSSPDDSTPDDNQASVLAPAAAVVVTFTTANDSNPSAGVFGDYLSGVSFANAFTARTSKTDRLTKKFEVSIQNYPFPGGKSSEIKAWKAGGTRFSIDPGKLPVGEHDVIVRALNANNAPVGEFKGKITVVANSSLQIKMKPKVGTGQYDIADLRLVEGVPVDLVGEATLGTLANWNFYANRIGLQFVSALNGKKGRILPFSGLDGNTLTIPNLNSSMWPNTVMEAGDDYHAFVVPLTVYSFKNPEKKLSPANALKVIALPEWLKPAVKSVEATEATIAAIGSNELVYHFTVKVGKAVTAAIPLDKSSTYGLFKNLQSSVSTQTKLDVYAKLVDTSDVKVKSSQSGVTAKVFNKVYHRYLDSDKITITGTIDKDTLAAPSKITVKTASPVSLLRNGVAIEFTFGEKYGKTPYRVEAPLFTNGFLGITGYASISGRLRAELSKLDLSATLNLVYDAKQKTFHVEDNSSNLKFDVAATLSASLTARVGVNAVVVILGGFNLLDAEAEGTLTLDITGSFGAKYVQNKHGQKTFEIDQDPAVTKGSATLSYDFTFDASDVTKNLEDTDNDKTATDEPPEQIEFWKLTT